MQQKKAQEQCIGILNRRLMSPTYFSQLTMKAILQSSWDIDIPKDKPLENDVHGVCTNESLVERSRIFSFKYSKIYLINMSDIDFNPHDPSTHPAHFHIDTKDYNIIRYKNGYYGQSNGYIKCWYGFMHCESPRLLAWKEAVTTCFTQSPFPLHTSRLLTDNERCLLVSKQIDDPRDRYSTYKTTLDKTHDLRAADNDTLHAIAHIPSEKHTLLYPGNAEDALRWQSVYKNITTDPSSNYIFWNYPGVGCNKDPLLYPDDLVTAGYNQVMALINKNIAPKNITLNGQSLGGAVALQVACRLYAEGHYVHLNIDRSFACIAAVVPAIIQARRLDTPLVSAIISLTIFGAAIGMMIAGLNTSIGLILSHPLPQTHAESVYNGIHILAICLGGCIAVIGALIGAILGLLLGGLLSGLSWLINKPITVPMTPAFSAFLYATCCEMDSVAHMEQLAKMHQAIPGDKPIVTVVQATNDSVIFNEASLNVGLGCPPPDETSETQNEPSGHIKLSWFNNGDHMGELSAPLGSRYLNLG